MKRAPALDGGARRRVLDATVDELLALFAAMSRRLRRVVAFDASVWRATDPSTGLMTSPIRVENLDDGGCSIYWQCEALADAVNRFSELARAPIPAAGLHMATKGNVPASSFYRLYLKPRGLSDELRMVMRTDDAPWGQISLFRRHGQPPFDGREVRFVAALSDPLARRMRAFVAPVGADDEVDVTDPGVILLDAHGHPLYANDRARAHLEVTTPDPAVSTALGLAVPAWMHSAAIRARAGALRGESPVARVCVRTRHGRWLICQASHLRGSRAGDAPTAVVLDVARPSDTASLLAAAYRLSERELEVTEAIAGGLSTSAIAARLSISRHTVRDHVKAIFEKTGTTSRGELVARLFT
jgi:DNA-binding CsgD family transcriptional regulator